MFRTRKHGLYRFYYDGGLGQTLDQRVRETWNGYRLAENVFKMAEYKNEEITEDVLFAISTLDRPVHSALVQERSCAGLSQPISICLFIWGRMVAKCDNNELLKRMRNIIIITNTTPPIETAESKEISLKSENEISLKRVPSLAPDRPRVSSAKQQKYVINITHAPGTRLAQNSIYNN